MRHVAEAWLFADNCTDKQRRSILHAQPCAARIATVELTLINGRILQAPPWILLAFHDLYGASA
jgi:hypothetical protein